MKKLLCMIIALVILASVCTVSIGATTPPAAYIGDVNDDGKVNIVDATIIQRVLAELEEETVYIRYLGDTDKDGFLTVADATKIQRRIAEIDKYYGGDWYNYDMMVDDFYADYYSGVARVGEPVTFTMNSRAGSPILSYKLYVNDECVATSETDNSLTYTFDKSGMYDVRMETVAMFATGERNLSNYVVIDKEENEELKFKTIYSTGKYWGTYAYNQDGMKMYAEGIGGTAPYQYKFEFSRRLDGAIYDPWYTSEVELTVQDYSEQNYFELPKIVPEYSYGYPGAIDCKMNIYIKDVHGDIVSKSIEFYYDEHPIG